MEWENRQATIKEIHSLHDMEIALESLHFRRSRQSERNIKNQETSWTSVNKNLGAQLLAGVFLCYYIYHAA